MAATWSCYKENLARDGRLRAAVVFSIYVRARLMAGLLYLQPTFDLPRTVLACFADD